MNNTLIVGKSGSGKTTGYMFNEIKKLIDKKENLIKKLEQKNIKCFLLSILTI